MRELGGMCGRRVPVLLCNTRIRLVMSAGVELPHLSIWFCRSNTPLWVVFTNDFWGTPLSDPESHKSYRPLTVLSFRLNHQIHGLWAPGFHTLNIAAHALVCLLYFWSCLGFGLQLAPSLIAALLFAAHPIHTEAVSASIVTLNHFQGIIAIVDPFISSSGCKHRGSVRDASCSILPLGSHRLPKVHPKTNFLLHGLGISNHFPLCHLSPLQRARCHCPWLMPGQRIPLSDRHHRSTE